MMGQEVILLNFPISHFLKSLAHSALNNTTYNASQTEIITRGVQLKYGGSVWHQEPGHLLQK